MKTMTIIEEEDGLPSACTGSWMGAENYKMIFIQSAQLRRVNAS